MSVRIEGTDEFAEAVDEIAVDGEEQTVEPSELFPDGFMRTHTEFESIDEFFAASPWTVETEADFERIPAPEFDGYVADHSSFDDWESMLAAGVREWVLRQTRG